MRAIKFGMRVDNAGGLVLTFMRFRQARSLPTVYSAAEYDMSITNVLINLSVFVGCTIPGRAWSSAGSRLPVRRKLLRAGQTR